MLANHPSFSLKAADDYFARSNDDIPPPLPPHGVPATTSAIATATSTMPAVGSIVNNGNEDYKPPVPPHRNTGVIVRLPETPRKHCHRGSSGAGCAGGLGGVAVPSAGGRNANHRHSKQILQHIKPHTKPRVDNAKENGEEEAEFVELVTHEENRQQQAKEARNREVKRATIVGNPMFSSFSTGAVTSSVNPSTPTAASSSSSPPSSSPSSSSSSSSSASSSSGGSSSQEQEESVALEDLNLGMDYNQIMQYFDNLKESNA